MWVFWVMLKTISKKIDFDPILTAKRVILPPILGFRGQITKTTPKMDSLTQKYTFWCITLKNSNIFSQKNHFDFFEKIPFCERTQILNRCATFCPRGTLGENIFSLTTDPSLSFGTKFGLLTCIWGLGQFCGNIYWPMITDLPVPSHLKVTILRMWVNHFTKHFTGPF